MSVRACASILSLVLAALVTTTTLAAPPNLLKLVPFRRVEADAEKSYEVSEQNGPWLVFATSFAGEGARRDAQRLVLELRKRYKLPAYTHQRRYDFSGSFQGLGLSRDGRPKQMRHQHDIAFDEIAVLVGDFPSWDDPAAQKALETIKYARPESLKPNSQRRDQQQQSWAHDVVRETQRDLRQLSQVLSRNSEQSKGPMGTAILSPNPLLPPEYFSAPRLDDFVLKMNRGVKHSLLDCPGRYSVRVATFRGNVVIDQREVARIEEGGRFDSRLGEAAEKAHRLTEALRQRGVEAFEFHDRHESIVAVGSFNSVGTPRVDGKKEINPAVHQVMQAYGPVKQPLVDGAGREVSGLQPRQLDGVFFDVQPIPVEVPRRSIGQDYATAGRLFR